MNKFMFCVVCLFAVSGCMSSLEELNPLPVDGDGGGDVQQPKRPPYQPPADPPVDAGCEIKVLGEEDLGPAFSGTQIAGSPQGYLAAWYPAWNKSAHVQVFDLEGKGLSPEAIVPDTEVGITFMVGSDSGYVLGSNSNPGPIGGTVIKLSPKGESMAHYYMDDSPSAGASSDGGAFVGWTKKINVGGQILKTLFQVGYVSESGLLGEPETPLDSDGSANDMVGMAAMGDSYAFGRLSDSENGPPSLSLVVRREDGTFKESFFAFLGPDDQKFWINDVYAFNGHYVVSWVQSKSQPEKWFLTHFGADGTIGLTYAVDETVAGLIHDLTVMGDGFVASLYDPMMLREAVVRLNGFGEVEGEIVVLDDEIKLYYMGWPRVAVADDKHFAVIRIDEPKWGETHVVVSFLACE